MKAFPTLYKRSNTGAIQQWSIAVAGPAITVTHGQVGGKLQTGIDIIKEGKNLGKANATTAEEQAEAEALAKWTKQKERNRYVEDISRAEGGETDAAGGIPPMLAQPEEAGMKKIKFPAHIQRKYNGNRCLAVIENGEVSLWSRKQKRILGMPHIEAAYREAFARLEGVTILDGELYRHGWSLQKISGFCRKEGTKPGFRQIKHVVYDLPSSDEPEHKRRADLAFLFAAVDSDCLELAPTEVITMREAVKPTHDAYVSEGYEGAILRNLEGKYAAGKRSYDLVKVKDFKELEFPIVDISEGRGKFAGKAIFTCRAENGKEFDCCAPGTLKDRAEFFERTEDGMPSHGVGLVVRDYE